MSGGSAGTPERRDTTGGEQEARLRQLRARIQMVRAGVTSFALLGGLSCYVLLLQFRLATQPVALAIGLVFALLVRVAAGSLARDWLRQQITGQDERRARDGRGTNTNGAPPPERAPR